jgi:uncharacterized protein DUF5995
VPKGVSRVQIPPSPSCAPAARFGGPRAYGRAVAVPPSTVPEVIAGLRALEKLPRGDGVACFARLYREVTEDVAAELAADRPADPLFLERLDIHFAGLFFAALDAPPPAWAPLFAARHRKKIAPLQFALCGVNAHINRDLPVALVETCRELGRELRAGSPEHAEFIRVNTLLARVEGRVKASYATKGWVGLVARLLHRADRLDDVIAMWNVERARDAAWANAMALWQLRSQPALSAEFLLALDRMVGLAGRGLLVPTGRLAALVGLRR